MKAKIDELIQRFNINLTVRNGQECLAVYGKPSQADVAEIKSLKPEITAELKRRKAEAEAVKAAEAAEKEAAQQEEIRAIKAGEQAIKLHWHDGEYLSAWEVFGEAARLLEELGLAKYVEGWGYRVDMDTADALGQEFTYPQAVELARPAMEAAEAARNKKAVAKAAKARERIRIINTTKPHQGPKGACSYCGKPGAGWSRQTAAGIKHACDPDPIMAYATAPSADAAEGCLSQLMREHEAWAEDSGMVRCWECGCYRQPSELDASGYCGC